LVSSLGFDAGPRGGRFDLEHWARETRPMAARWIAPTLTGIALVAIFLGLRAGLGLEFSAASVSDAVERMGPLAPLAYVGIVVFRVPLGLPSQLVLVGGGALFGAAAGTLYGAIGLLLSALVYFLGARWAGREAVEARLPERFRGLLEVAGSRAGALFVGVGTAYPFGPITSYHLLAGVTAMAVWIFLVSVAVGSLVRAALYTTFGSALIAGDAKVMLGAAALTAAVVALPLCFRTPRAWLLQALGRRQSLTPRG